MDRRRKSRRAKAGETLTETLVAMLVIGLASVLFLTMVGASGRIFRTSEDGYKKFYDKITTADVQSPPADPAGPPHGTMTVKGGAAETVVNVDWYGETDYVWSYKVSG